jgi:hypothetical protein
MTVQIGRRNASQRRRLCFGHLYAARSGYFAQLPFFAFSFFFFAFVDVLGVHACAGLHGFEAGLVVVCV